MENINLETTSILKSADDFTSFTAVIMEPEVDLHGDIASEDVIKKAAHEYLKNQKMQSKIEHKIPTKDISLVESFILDEEKDFNGTIVKKGSWIGKFQVNSDEIKQKIKSGEFKGVSIGATAVVEEITKSMDNPYKDNPKRRIKEVKIVNEISTVSYPANNRKILQLNKSFKNVNKGEEMTFEEIMKKLNSDPELKEKVQNEFNGKKESKKSEEEIKKGLDPQVLDILKAKEDRLAVLEKAYEDTLRKEFSLKVEEIKKFSKCDDSLVDCMMKISKSMPKEYSVIEKSLLDAVDTIKKSDKMQTIGVDNPQDLSISTGFDRIEVIAKGLMEKDISLTKEQAISKVYLEKLY